ncbi:hypothetical protein GH721_10270 [Kriegella sp. EG-1]|nr:hypothetical protein [Flavobacteriaceae bacterium EG-1]
MLFKTPLHISKGVFICKQVHSLTFLQLTSNLYLTLTLHSRTFFVFQYFYLMKRILALVVFLVSSSVFAQEGAIRGTILDQEMNNEPFLFANISLKGDNLSKQTNLFGNFEINNVKPGDYIVQISFAGYNTKEVPVQVTADNITEIQETLSAITFEFDETLLNSKESKKIAVNTISSK